MKPFPIPEPLLRAVAEQAEREYPSECCGMMLGPVGKPSEFSRVRPCRNVQDDNHALDPENFPRPARTAYFIDPKELLAIHRDLRRDREEIRVIYHSHIETGAYFSEEDTRVAAPEGEPAYPGVDYLVVSLAGGKVQEANLFRWASSRKKFLRLSYDIIKS